MMKVIAVISLIATIALAMPYVEDEVVEEDALLQHVYSDATPLSQFLQKENAQQKASEHAAAEAEANTKAADAAAAVEAKWTKEEAGYKKQTAGLNKAARDAQRQATKDNANDAKKLAEDQLKTTKEVKETNEATAAAEEEYEKLQAEYSAAEHDQNTKNAAAAVAAKARAAKYGKEMASIKGELETETKEGETIQQTMKDDAKKLKQDQKDIVTNYKSTLKTLAKQNAADKAELAGEKAAMQAKLAADLKDSNNNAAAAKAAVAAEKEKNDKDAAAAKAAIKKRYGDVAAEHAKAEALHKEHSAQAAAALASTREGTQKKFAKEAVKSEAQYQAAMGKAAALKAKADHAHEEWETAMADSDKEQDRMDREGAEEAAADAEMAECALDGSECQTDDGKCHKTTLDGPYMAEDLVSCSDTKPEEQHYAGTSWAGVPPPLPKEKLPSPSPACEKAKKEFGAGKYGFALNPPGDTAPTVALACHNVPENKLAEKKEALLQYFDMAAECPPWCVPGTATSDGLVADTNGICITGQDTLMFKQQISDLPEWKHMGTNNKIPGNAGIMSICKMAKNFVAGFREGVDATPGHDCTPRKCGCNPLAGVKETRFTDKNGCDACKCEQVCKADECIAPHSAICFKVNGDDCKDSCYWRDPKKPAFCTKEKPAPVLCLSTPPLCGCPPGTSQVNFKDEHGCDGCACQPQRCPMVKCGCLMGQEVTITKDDKGCDQCGCQEKCNKDPMAPCACIALAGVSCFRVPKQNGCWECEMHRELKLEISKPIATIKSP